MSPPSQVACSGAAPRGHEPEGRESSVGEPTFLKEKGPPFQVHLPGGTPEEMVEADTWPWPLAVMAATSMV